MVLVAGQLARRLGVPLHTVGALTASKIPDAQALQESTYGLTMSVLAGANFINHACGWLEGGLVSGFEKSVIDADLCGKLSVFTQGMDLSDNAQAMDAIREVGPGEHFLASQHTLKNFATAFYRPLTADNNSFEQWKAEGSLDAARRANKIWKDLLARYEPPPIDPGVWEGLKEYVAKRKASLPDQPY